MIEKILFCGYRDWAIEIYQKMLTWDLNNFTIDIATETRVLNKKIKEKKYNVIFFIGWSWIIPKEIIDSNICVCLHPSPLPKYKGGSPIQHQIINGETSSAVTFFIMDEKIDHGPILWQKEFNLEGELSEIFNKIKSLGYEGLKFILKKHINKEELLGETQDHTKSTFFKRRKPHESEIKTEDFSTLTAQELYNKIRALGDPYPNAYITCKDDTRLLIKKADLDD